MADAGTAIATIIATAVGSAAPGAAGSYVFNGPARPDPAKAIFCLAHGGPAPIDYQSGASVQFAKPQVIVRVREEAGSFRLAETLARSAHAACSSVAVSGYLDCRVLQSHPLYMGPDDQDRHEFSFTVELTLDE